MPLKIAILASGRGSNAQTIINAIDDGTLSAEIQCLICNNPGAPVLDMAREAGIPTHIVPHAGLSREDHEARVLEALDQYEIDYLVLAGYMRLMTPKFLRNFKLEGHYRIINIHPSLLPAFPGTNAYEDAFHYGVKVSGITVHFVNEQMDNGPINCRK
jgi:phosphoribosylglycinamide formyltransferase 1